MSVRLRQGYGATVFARFYDASEDWITNGVSRKHDLKRISDSGFIADRLSKAGWSLGWVSALDSEGRTIGIADAHRGDGKRFVVRCG